MSSRTLLPTLTAGLLCAASLTGCLTQRVKPPPSPAVLQARAVRTAKPAACSPGGLEAISPLDASFAFDDATVSAVGQQRLAAAVRWLGCNPGVEVVIKPDGDNHGDAAHLNDLAQRRATAVSEQLRGLGATAPVIHMLSRNAADPVAAPHLLINAIGRGW
jgi:outer membrane protein OmpA-like peptidoglycan-associated protein